MGIEISFIVAPAYLKSLMIRKLCSRISESQLSRKKSFTIPIFGTESF